MPADRQRTFEVAPIQAPDVLDPEGLPAVRCPVEHVSVLSHGATLSRLVEVIEAAGTRVFARIDHATGAHEAGLAMRPSVVLVYGRAKRGTPISQAQPRAALELPPRVPVRESDEGQPRLSFHPTAPLLRAAGVDDGLAKCLDPARQILLQALGR